jgi:hypothetical protein
VTGVGGGPSTGLESASIGTPAEQGSPENPSSIHSENGFGSSSQVPGVSPAALRIGAGVPAAHAAGSAFPNYLLMVLIALVAVAVGLLASRATRHRPRGDEPRGDRRPPTSP